MTIDPKNPRVGVGTDEIWEATKQPSPTYGADLRRDDKRTWLNRGIQQAYEKDTKPQPDGVVLSYRVNNNARWDKRGGALNIQAASGQPQDRKTVNQLGEDTESTSYIYKVQLKDEAEPYILDRNSEVLYTLPDFGIADELRHKEPILEGTYVDVSDAVYGNSLGRIITRVHKETIILALATRDSSKQLFRNPAGHPSPGLLGNSTGHGPHASGKIGGLPPQRDGKHKNGLISCPDRAAIPMPERYNLDQTAPYGSKKNPMTPLCRLLPKGKLVEYRSTRTSFTAAAAAIKAAWKKRIGSPLVDAQAAVLVGQWGMETAGGHSFWNYNPAGVKAYTGWTGSWVIMRTTEYASPEARQCGHSCLTWVMSPFRAFDTLEKGIENWISLLTGSRHGVGKPYILAGDFMGYAKAIGPASQGGSNYFTASPERYGKGLKSQGTGWLSGAKV